MVIMWKAFEPINCISAPLKTETSVESFGKVHKTRLFDTHSKNFFPTL